MKSQTQEDYIRAIYLLEIKQGEVKSKELAGYLQVRKSSVSEMVSKLKEAGMLNCEKYSRLSLTKKARELAEKLTFKHRVIEAFLTNVLRRNKNEVHNEAHRLEHAFSDESIKRIYALIGKPTIGAHGEEIPSVRL